MPISWRNALRSKDAARWPLVVTCSEIGCNYTVCASDMSDAERVLHAHETDGPCPYGEKVGQVAMPVGKSIIERLWDELDGTVAKAVSSASSPDMRAECNGKAQGLAWSIHVMCGPFWETVNDVLVEAAKRHRIATGQEPFSPTPGYDYPHQVQQLVAREKKATQAAEPKHPMDEVIRGLGTAKIGKIQRALNGGFSARDLAEMYFIPLEAINRLRAQPGRFADTAG